MLEGVKRRRNRASSSVEKERNVGWEIYECKEKRTERVDVKNESETNKKDV